MKDIIKNDRVKILDGKYAGYKGFVTRSDAFSACVVIKGSGFDQGVWFDLESLHRTKRYKSEQ